MVKKTKSSAVASDVVRLEWRRRAEVEYRSAAYAHLVTEWLLHLGAPPTVIRAGLRIVADEIAHSELSYRVHRFAGGTDSPHITRESMSLRRIATEPLENDVTRAIVEVFCLGETVAVPLFHHLRRGCTVPVARRALDRVLRDEVRHRDFGWRVLDWLLSLPQGTALRELIERELGAAFSRLRRAYTPAHGQVTAFDEANRAWGMMDINEYAGQVARTLPKIWIPRFKERGIDAERAYFEGRY